MRLGGHIHEEYSDPAGWAAAVRKLGYSAAYCPVGDDASDDDIRAYKEAAAGADIVISEVGAWGNNPVSADDGTRRRSIENSQAKLRLADAIGACCCVNVSGSRGGNWAGPHEEDLTDATFALIVDGVREIIDGVQPKNTYFTLEAMQWSYPDSPESYARLIDAIGRERFAVHLDPTNLVCSPQRYYHNTELIRECFRLLGPRIKSCHAKDVLMDDKALVHLSEVLPGTGRLDYQAYLEGLAALDEDTPLMLEHLSTAEEYERASEHIRGVAREMGLEFK